MLLQLYIHIILYNIYVILYNIYFITLLYCILYLHYFYTFVAFLFIIKEKVLCIVIPMWTTSEHIHKCDIFTDIFMKIN